MNYKINQLVERTVARHTAFSSFQELVTCALNHGYTPTIRPSRSQGFRVQQAIRALAQQFDEHFISLGLPNRSWRGSDAI